MSIGDFQLEQIKETNHSLIYRGVRKADNLPVIIKLIKQEYPHPETINCFQQEYEIINCLSDPGIIKAYDLIRYKNRLAIVLEDCAAQSLRDILENQTLQLEIIIEIAREITTALQSIHKAKVIHKDLNPSNILFNQATKEIKIIDFGIATQLPKEQKSISNYKTLEGTLAYISPEQTGRMNRGLDYRSDYYSLGVTLYELLTKQLPFKAQESMELIHAHLAKIPSSPQQIKPEIPQPVSEIVMKLMAKNAEDRYQSAAGLRHDLEICLNQLNSQGEIQEFELRQQDRCDHFIIPDQLYGRESEVKRLLDSFERVAPGKSEMMLVAGFSGIGKTAVVNEVHKPITRQKGYFIKGKFDQFNRNIPFSAFVQAFSGLVQQLLAESDEKLSQWKSEILLALGNNAQVIIDVIPYLEIILGEQPAVAELSGNAAQNRFNLVFGQFVQVFTKQEHPLVIFLDDLQWADSASLGLLKLLMSEATNSSLLVIGAYRDNEVFSAHPLMLCLQEIDQQKANINTITLKPLVEQDINCLVADTLLCPPIIAASLSGLIYQQTQGNPFFTTQFLKGLYEDGYIDFNQEENCWQCELTQLKQLNLTNDVVKFMVARLQKLPVATQEVLKLAACIGNRFDLETLAIICEKSEVEVTNNLWTALQAGLIIPESQIYRLYDEDEIKNTLENSTVEYRFLHDRVQQAAYILISQVEKEKTHYLIGKLLKEQTSLNDLESNIFTIIGQLNIAHKLISKQTERDELAKLNLTACYKAKSATAYDAGLIYARMGISFLGQDSWQRQYDLSLIFHELIAELSSLKGDTNTMEDYAQIINIQAKNPLDLVNVSCTRIQSYHSQNKLLESVDTAIQTLRKLEIILPEYPMEADINQAIRDVERLTKTQDFKDLIDLPMMVDQKSIAILKIINNVAASAFTSSSKSFPLLIILGIKLSFKQGHSPYSPLLYLWYGGILACNFLRDIETGLKFEHLAMNLIPKLNSQVRKTEALTLLSFFLLHRKNHIKDTLDLIQNNFNDAVEVGNFQYAGHSAESYCIHALECGQSLINVEKKSSIYIEKLSSFGQLITANYCKIFRQFTLHMLPKANDNISFSSDALIETSLLTSLISSEDICGLFYFYFYKLILCYLFEKLENTQQYRIELNKYLPGVEGTIIEPSFYFYHSLTLLKSLEPPSRIRSDLLSEVDYHQKILQDNWVTYTPMNYEHKYNLVEAEKNRVLGNKVEALELYDRAIAGAKENQFIQEEALANELAAKFYLDWGKEKVAAGYMQEAYYCYAQWGAKAKTNHLEQNYPQLLRPILEQKQQAFNPLQTLSSLSSFSNSTGSSIQTNFSLNDTFDLIDILRAAQALTEILELDELLQKISQIILQNSGSDRLILALVADNNSWEIKVDADTEKIEVFNDLSEINLHNPARLINYVKNTQETLLVDNLETELPIIDDYLIAENPQSLLALPLKYQEKLTGILYLHSANTRGLFSPEKTIILEFLCSQAAIAIQNSQLFTQEQEKSRQLKASQQKLESIIKQAPVAIIEWSQDLEFQTWNPTAEKIFGYSAEEISGKHFSHIVPPEYKDYVDEVAHDILNKNGGSHAINENITKNNHRITCEWFNAPMKDIEGKVCGGISMALDISDRQAAEAEQKRQLDIIDSTSDFIGTTDPNGKILYLNQAWKKLLQEDCNNSIARIDISQQHPGWALEIVANQGLPAAVKHGMWKGETAILDSNDREIPVSQVIIAHKTNDGEVDYFSTIIRDISDRKATEESLIKSENKFRTLVSNIHGAVYRSQYDANWTIDYMSPAIEDLSGYPATDFIQNKIRTYTSIIHPEDIDYIDQEVSAAVAKQKSFILEYRILHRNGTIRWVFEKGKGIYNSQGEILYFEGVIFDISDRKNLEQEQKKLTTILESTSDYIGVADTQGKAIWANRKLKQLRNLEDIEEIPVSFFHPEWVNQMIREEAFPTAIKEGTWSGETVLLDAEGQEIPISQVLIAHKNPQGEVEYFSTIMRDISQQKLAEKQLKASEQRYAYLTAAAPVGIFRTDAQGNCVYVNDRSCQIIGLSSEAALGQGWNNRLHEDDRERVISEWYQSVQEERPFKLEYRFKRPDGSISWVFGQSVAERNTDGEIIGFVGTVTDISDRKAAEAALKLSEARAKAAFEQAAVGIAESDMQGGYLTKVNEYFAQMIGYTRAELLNLTIKDLTYPDDLAESKTYIQQLYSGEIDNFTLEKRYIHQNGSVFWSATTVSLIDIPGEKAKRCLGIIKDISDRKAAEQELYHSKHLLQLVLDTIPQLVFWKDSNLVYLGCNQEFAKVAGLDSPNQIVGKTDYDLPWKPEESDFFVECDRRIMSSGQAELGIIEPQLTAEGKQTWIETNKSPLLDESGAVIGILGNFQDITTQKEAEQTLQRINEELEERVFERTADLEKTNLALTQAKYQVEKANEYEQALNRIITDIRKSVEIKQIFQVTTEKLRKILYCERITIYQFGSDWGGKFVYESKQKGLFPLVEGLRQTTWNDSFLMNQEHEPCNFNSIYEVSDIYQTEHALCHIEALERFKIRAYLIVPIFVGESLWGLLAAYNHSQPRQWQSEEVRLLQQVASHLGVALKQLELLQEMTQAKEKADNASQAKSDFLSSMSHELRTPLNGILGYAQILQRDRSLTEKQVKGLQIIHQSGNHLLNLISDILDLSKIEARKLELCPSKVNLSVFLDSIIDIIRMQAFAKDILFAYEVAHNLPQGIKADEKRLRQVLINLLGNAVKFTEQGQVTLKVTGIEQIPHQTSTLRFEVIDTGVGMTPEQLATIFQPFEQVGDKKKQAMGTGLGLAISNQLIQLMGGAIQVTSQLGEGSNFWFEITLPITEIDIAIKAEDTISRVINYQGDRRKLLVVDDKTANRLLMQSILEPLGFEIIMAENGQEAVDLAQTTQLDLILTDLMMPVKSGFEAVAEIRQIPQKQELPIIAVSASVLEVDIIQSKMAGCNAFLSKPIEEEELLSLLEEYLDLTWIYEQIEEYHTPSQTQTTQQAAASTTLVLPPTEELEKLYDLAMLGSMRKIRTQASYLEELDEQYAPLAAKLKDLANGFQEKAIVNLIEQCLTKISNQ